MHAKTNVSEFVKFLDDKKKIKYFYLDNGNNSSNEFIAKWLWYYKNTLGSPPPVGFWVVILLHYNIIVLQSYNILIIPIF